MGSESDLTQDEAKFTALVERQSRFAYRVAYAVLLNAQDAEDAVQECFLKLFRHGGWQQAENGRAYVARVAMRTAIDRRRASRPAAGPEAALEISSPHPSPERVAIAADQHRRIHAMIDALPKDLRLPLVLSTFEELNSRLIAGILHIPEGTVRTRLQRARQLLKQKLTATESNLETRREEPHHA